jgi:2-hydroxychromene-2-carboxylate isomerase
MTVAWGRLLRSMADIEFFLDPICPWAWITSRFVTEVSEQTDLDITWRFISLRMVNEEKDYEKDFPKGYPLLHGTGSAMLRVAAAARDHGGNDAVAALYTEYGQRLHIEGASFKLWKGEDTGDLVTPSLEAAGLPVGLAAAADDASWDDVLRAETDTALSRTGKDVGTPIITFDTNRPEETSLFGPVINRIPRGREAVELWDALLVVATTPGLAELKRSLRGDIDFN